MFGRNRVRLPYVRDYAEAIAVEAKIKPMRGKDVKPLGRRSNHFMQNIRKDSNGNVMCRLYDTDVLTYRPDGMIVVKLNGYVTQSTCHFVTELLGVVCFISDHKTWIKCDNRYVPLNSTEENFFKREAGALKPLKDTYPVKHRLRRKEANNVRRMVQPFRDYLALMGKVREDGIYTKQEIQNGVKKVGSKIDPEKLMQLIMPVEGEDKTEDYYKASLLLASNIHNYWAQSIYMPTAYALHQLDDILFRHFRDQVFEAHEVTDGSVVKDAYRKFFL